MNTRAAVAPTIDFARGEDSAIYECDECHASTYGTKIGGGGVLFFKPPPGWYESATIMVSGSGTPWPVLVAACSLRCAKKAAKRMLKANDKAAGGKRKRAWWKF